MTQWPNVPRSIYNSPVTPLLPPAAPQSGRGSKGPKIANRLIALSSAAVLTIYTAGYLRTRSAAEKLEAASAERRPARSALAPAAPAPVKGLPAAAAAPAQPRATNARPIQRAAPRPASAPASAPEAPLPTLRSVTAVPAVTSTDAPAPTTTPVPVPTTTTVEPPAAEAPVAPPQPQYKDGTYLGWGTSRHGDIQASVVIESGRIASATIAQCLTRYSCSWIAHLPGQVVSRQSPDVDYVSGATQSSNAFYYAVAEALSKAK
jgi:uncharacterized protein with FMN-binding domain